ncbi:proline iminopeptidase-family hydrolase [Gudongella sp. DL1XJH-153]|uniref:proline iminopeptidase-family hydrolase n=1 Tax=Gudongella sp. DL1XJH-153 TaxID=3409804 RepID=UPI003BB5B0A9
MPGGAFEVKEGFIETEKGRIWYSVYGEDKKGVPLLVVHGGPGFLSMPQVIKDLADERPVYFYDQLGCGKSDKAENPEEYSVENYVRELDEVIRDIGLSEVILFGHSWGAGLVCSHLLDMKPEVVKKLVLSSPYLSTPKWEEDMKKLVSKLPESMVEIVRKAEETNEYGEEYFGVMMEFYKRHMYTHIPFPDYLMEAFGAINQEVYGMLWGPSEFEITGKLKSFDLSPRLGEITVPVLLICGDQDEMDVRTIRDFQMAIPNAQMAVIPDAGHMNHLEKPEIFKAIARDFLA